MKLIDKLKAQQELILDHVPYECISVFGNRTIHFRLMDTEICLGEDYVSLETARKAVEWYVEQLGGTVKWSKFTVTEEL